MFLSTIGRCPQAILFWTGSKSVLTRAASLLFSFRRSRLNPKWVRTELQYAFYKEQQDNRKFILPVVLDDCKPPIHVAGRIYVELKTDADYDRGLQYLLNAIQGRRPFSAMVAKFLEAPPESPYTDKAQREGRRLLVELAQHRETDVGENQRWLLWELFHALLVRYTCTLKISRGMYSSAAKDAILFELIDRWNVKGTFISLKPEEFQQGLWSADVDLSRGLRLGASDMLHLGAFGKLSAQGRFNSHTNVNPFLSSSAVPMQPVIESLRAPLSRFDEGSQQSFLFDLQTIVFANSPHAVKIVVGSGTDDLCRAMSIRQAPTRTPKRQLGNL
jgi:hypothetical protein